MLVGEGTFTYVTTTPSPRLQWLSAFVERLITVITSQLADGKEIRVAFSSKAARRVTANGGASATAGGVRWLTH